MKINKNTYLTKRKRTINILGTVYQFNVSDTEDSPELAEIFKRINNKQFNYCSTYKKLIIVHKWMTNHDQWREEVKRNILECFIYESGLEDYSSDSQLMEWLTEMFCRMYTVFEKYTVKNTKNYEALRAKDTISILGTQYKFIKVYNAVDWKRLNELGYFNRFGKKIVVDAAVIKGDLKSYYQNLEQTIRHEIIHGFFYESGLRFYGADEILVEWLALQFPKIVKVLKRLEAL